MKKKARLFIKSTYSLFPFWPYYQSKLKRVLKMKKCIENANETKVLKTIQI